MKKYDHFATLAELRANPNLIDNAKGVYAVFYTADKPTFNEIGTGGHFKKRNPNVGLDILKDRWVEGSKEIYIGKATNLRSRIKSYLDFGIGKAVGHYGGRYIWQIADQDNFLIGWKVIDKEDPRVIEKQWIQNFEEKFGKRPFANINR